MKNKNENVHMQALQHKLDVVLVQILPYIVHKPITAFAPPHYFFRSAAPDGHTHSSPKQPVRYPSTVYRAESGSQRRTTPCPLNRGVHYWSALTLDNNARLG